MLEPLSGYLRAGQLLAEKGPGIHGEAFNIGPAAEQNHTVLELLKSVSRFWKSGSMENSFEICENKDFKEAGLLKLNCDKALAYLQWKPTLNFEETARLTGAWYDHYYNKGKKDLTEYTLDQIRQYVGAAKNKMIGWAL